MWLTPIVGLLMASTVYGRYHYGIDVMAGAFVGAIGLTAARALAGRCGVGRAALAA
jgi:membrane-associated phospholipid phosphatase